MSNTKENQPEVVNRLGVLSYCSFQRERQPSAGIYRVLGPLEEGGARNSLLCLVLETDP